MTLPTNLALFAAAAVAVFADQASKVVAGRLLADGRVRLVAWRSGFRWVLNSRGSVAAMPVRWAVVVWIAVLAAAGLVALQGPTWLGTGGAVGLGLAVGGATSNLGDRLLRGAVVDFLVLRAWPTFNLADAAMVAGLALLAGSVA